MSVVKKFYKIAFLTSVLASTAAMAQQGQLPVAGLTSGEIVLGRAAAFSGPDQKLGQQMRFGFEAQFRQLNEEGGVFGKKIKMLEYDDGGKDAKTAEGVGILLKKYDVFAIIGTTGAKSTKAIVPLLNQYKVPLIGAYSGDVSTSLEFNKYVFNVQASYLDQIKSLADYASQSGLKTFALLQEEVGDSKLAQLAVDEFKKRGVAIIVAEGIDSKSTPESIKASADRVTAKAPQAILSVGTSSKSITAINAVVAAMPGTQIFVLPTKDTTVVAQELGLNSYGVIASQVMPLPFSNTEIASEYKQILKKYYPKEQVSFVGLQAFVTAKVITEALKRTGQAPTREKFISALESLKMFDVGGVIINYGANQHNGSQFVEIVMVGKNAGKDSFNFIN